MSPNLTLRTGRARTVEAHRGFQSFQNWLKKTAAPRISKDLAVAQSWQNVHQAFARCDVELKLHGAGLAATDRSSKAVGKVRDCGRTFSLVALTRRFGEFVPAGEAAKTVRPSISYVRSRMPRAAKQLYAAYQAESSERKSARQLAMTAIKEAHELRVNMALNHFKAERLKLAASIQPLPMRRLGYSALSTGHRKALDGHNATFAHERRALNQQHAPISWQGFLQARAEAGDIQALEVLRAGQKKQLERLEAAGEIFAADRASHRTWIDTQRMPKVRWNGTVVYASWQGMRATHVLDRADAVLIDRSDNTQALLAALLLAKKRFEGQDLVVHGSSGFQAACLKVAIAHGLDIKFADSELDQRRVQGVLKDVERGRELSRAEKPTQKVDVSSQLSVSRPDQVPSVPDAHKAALSALVTQRASQIEACAHALKQAMPKEGFAESVADLTLRPGWPGQAWKEAIVLMQAHTEGGDRPVERMRQVQIQLAAELEGREAKNLQTMLNQEAAAMADPLAELMDAQEQGKSR